MQNLQISTLVQTSKLRAGFWILGTLLAVLQAWSYRYFVTSDAVSYLDMSDAVIPGGDWHRIITGVWSPLYPFLLGITRGIVRPNVSHEIAVAHMFNVVVFLFAFLCFEFLLDSVSRQGDVTTSEEQSALLPGWAYLSLAYTLFIWSSITQISLQSLRPDMLMSGFVYLAVGMLYRMRGRPANWRMYLVLGFVLGIGYLAKAPMLPLGILFLLGSLLLVQGWRRAVPMAACATLLLFLIGSFYFVPLSRQRGHFTLGESSSFNYLVHVNQAGPGWYLQDVGSGSGKFQRSPRKIWDLPPTFEFCCEVPGTHPLRFDPSYWTQGARPRFRLLAQLSMVARSLYFYDEILFSAGGLVTGFLALCFVTGSGRLVVRDVLKHWPLWVSGLLGLGMYALIHAENRYVGVFFLLFWMGLFFALRVREQRSQGLLSGVVLGIVITILIPIGAELGNDLVDPSHNQGNSDASVATALRGLGIRPGDPVARISTGGDLGWARVARVSVISEVDWQAGANSFWTAGPETQGQVLQALAKTGAEVVVAHSWGSLAPPGWQRLGGTQYWAYRLAELPRNAGYSP